MLKVTIVTIYDLSNYGNRLQNYALNVVLHNMGFNVSNFVSKTKIQQRLEMRMALRHFFYGEKRKNAERDVIFLKFTQKNMPINSKKQLQSDYYISGSDQVWHPNWYGTPTMFLRFAPKEKRISYAASFGVSDIPDVKKREYSKYLSEMNAISVREESGAKIVKELTGRDVPVLIDPTMMLDKQEWQVIAKKPQIKVPNHYLLTYYLGEVSLERNTYIEQVANDNNLDIIRLETRNPTDAWYQTGPAEFIWLIEHCALLCTDSFHGSVFSVLMDVPFLVFDREDQTGDMSTRIDNLLSKLKLKNRKFADQRGNEVFRRDYRHIPEILAEERKKANTYIKEALGIL